MDTTEGIITEQVALERGNGVVRPPDITIDAHNGAPQEAILQMVDNA